MNNINTFRKTKVLMFGKRIKCATGLTLLEVVLYIAIFAILITSTIYLVFSMNKTINSVHVYRKYRMMEMYIYSLSTDLYYKNGFLNKLDLQNFSNKISPYLDIASTEILSIEEFDSSNFNNFELQINNGLLVDVNHNKKYLKISMKIENSFKEIYIYMI